MKWRAIILASLVAPLCLGLAGCNSAANEAEDVQDAQEKLSEERKDQAAED